jgi:hypothetical protein
MRREYLSSQFMNGLIRQSAGLLIAGLVLFTGVHIAAASAPQPHRLPAMVTDLQGKPLGSVTVCLGDGNTELRDQTDALGPYGSSIDPGVWKLSVHTEQYASPLPEALTVTNADTEKILVLKPRARLVSDPLLDGGGESLPAVSDGTPLKETEEGPSVHSVATGTSQKGWISPPEIQLATQVPVAKTMLEDLEIIGPDPPVASNRSQVTFRCVAYDTLGQKMTIRPQWRLEPPGAGATSYSRNGEMFTFAPHEDFIGQVKVFLTDSISGQTAEFNASDSLSECDQGLAVYHRLSGGAPESSVGDRQGFRMIIPQGAIPQGETTLISLRKPPVLELKRITPGYQLWGQIFDVRASDDVSFFSNDEVSFARPLELILPLVSEARSHQTIIGRWSYQDLEWSSLGGTASAEEISVQVDHLSQFAVLSPSASLGLKDIQLLPNPFTPHDPYGLQLAFTLSTDAARKPFVTIRVYTMAGDLVRTICENEPIPKGTYRPGERFLDSRGRDITCWDGRTDSGEMARNGRYVIQFQVTDSGGTVEALKTAVLIK